jgi:hypothetical protein
MEHVQKGIQNILPGYMHFRKIFNPMYRAHSNWRSVIIRSNEFTNWDVVWCNLYLTLKNDPHINIEICSDMQAVKYIYKYVYKGHYWVTVQLHQQVPQDGWVPDEISYFLDRRYVSASEVCWRIFRSNLFYSNPVIIRLVVYLPNQQQVYNWDGQNIEQKLRNLPSILPMAWFVFNEQNERNQSFIYKGLWNITCILNGNKWTPHQ